MSGFCMVISDQVMEMREERHRVSLYGKKIEEFGGSSAVCRVSHQ